MEGNVGLGDDRSIPKLMEFLKTAFRPSHFDDVQEILTKREEKWKVEEERLKEEIDVLRLDKIVIEDDYEELKKIIFMVNNDRVAVRVRERKLLEEIHNGMGLEEAEFKQVILKVIELEKEKSAAEAAAVLWKGKYEDLELRVSRLEKDALLLGSGPPVVDDVEEGLRANSTVPQNGNCEVPSVRVETDVSNCNDTLPETGNSNFARVKIEVDESDFDERACPVGAQTPHSPKADFENSQEAGKIAIEAKNEELNHQILSANNIEAGSRTNGTVPVVNNIGAGLRANSAVPENGSCEIPHVKVETVMSNRHGTAPKYVNSSFAHVKREVYESNFNEHTCPVGAQTRPSLEAGFDNSQEAGSKGHEDHTVIEISDSDDDSHLDILPEKSAQTPQSKRMRKQESEAQNCCTDDNTQPSKRACLQEQMSVERTSLSNMSEFFLDNIEDCDSFSDSDSDNSVDESTSVVKKYRKWNDAMEMGIVLEKDTELCMDAVCALYRQEILPMGLACSKLRGFIPSDALRGIELAKFLINGDKQGKRVKSVKELMEHDKKGAEDCKKIASRFEHCMQLFDIYKSQKDPFFPS